MKCITCFLWATITALFICTQVIAQPPSGYTFGPPDGHFSPDGIFDSVSDGRGHKFSLGEIAISDTIRFALTGHLSPTKVSSCNPGYFKVFLEDGCGMEDPANPTHVARLNVLCQVLTDISTFISSPGTGQFVNLWVRPEISHTVGGAAGVGSPFFNVPKSPTASGITDNAMWITINSGKDAFTNVVAPIGTYGGGVSGSSFFHGAIAFNWDPSINWTTSLTVTPAAGEIDLYTVALHEMMHVLGFASIIDVTGQSIIGSAYPYFTRYDSKLQTAGGVELIPSSSSSTCDLYNRSFNLLLSTAILSPGGCPTSHSNYSNCATAINYVSTAQTIPVYTPDCFQFGSSLSHFEDECYTPSGFVFYPPSTSSNDQYFVMSNSIPPVVYPYSSAYPGVMKRYLQPEERQVLCDIGYSVAATFGNPGNHNYYNYGSSCGQSVAGINDGISSGGFSFVSTPSVIKVNINPTASPTKQLLSNDNAAKFKCLEVIIGDGTLEDLSGVPVDHGDNTTNIYFVPGPSAHGLQLIRYIPTNSSGTVEGNITYVYVYVDNGNCPLTACNLISNGDFESSGSVTDCWQSYSGSPDRFYVGSLGYGIPNPGYMCCTISETGVHPYSTSNNAFLGLHGEGPDPVPTIESINQTLPSPLSAGTYTLSFWAKFAENVSFNAPVHLQFATSNTLYLSPISDYMTGLPSFLDPLADIVISHPDNQWQLYTQTVTCTSSTPQNSLVVLPASYLNPTSYPPNAGHYIVIDDIKILDIVSTCSFTPPATLCLGAAPLDLRPYVSIPGGYFEWETTPVITGIPSISYSYMFDPSFAYPASVAKGGTGTIPVCYNYTDGNGCTQQVCANIFTYVPPITGYFQACIGQTTPLLNGYPGGTWSSGNTSVATIDITTGVVTGVSAGTASMIYTSSCGTALATVTINTTPTISGPSAICGSYSITLSSAPTGGVWNSSNILKAIVSSSGVVTGVSAGTAVITYIPLTGCAATQSVTVSPFTPITGTKEMCLGFGTVLTDATSGGVWSSSNTSIATVGSGTGTVTSVSAGTASISYMVVSMSCGSITTVTVDPVQPITGSSTVCESGSTVLSNSVFGGTWSSSNTLQAVIGSSSGICSGVAIGTATITYTTSGGCISTMSITTLPSPTPIIGLTPICLSSTTTFSDATTGGSWSSDNTSAATIGISSGILTGVALGTSVISYVLSNGCSVSTTATIETTVASITGTTTLCVGTSSSLSDAVSGGVWSSGNTSIATVGSSTGIVTGVSAGTVTITYTNTCGYATTTATIFGVPGSISGLNSICTGMMVTWSNATPGGSWSSNNTSVATIDPITGVVTGIGIGGTLITYSMGGACYTHTLVIVNTSPAAISGNSFVCNGNTTTLSDATGGGVWSSDVTTTATVGAFTGVVTAVATGTTTISYTHGSCSAIKAMTVYATPAAIGTVPTICSASPLTLTDAVSGGSWSSSNTAVGTIDATTGVVTGIAAGTTTITYNTGGSCLVSKVVTVDMTPVAISGPTSICLSSSTTLTDIVSGGTWSSTNTSVATINATTGVLNGIAIGTATISYTKACGTVTTTVTITTTPSPITGTTSVCIGSSITMSDAAIGGTWSSASTGIATIDASTGVINGLSAGTSLISYYLSSGCVSTIIVTVLPLPVTISGATSVCPAFTITLSDATAGGLWSSSATTIATVGTSSGIVTGVSSGTVTISYTKLGCSVTQTVTVLTAPAITGGGFTYCDQSFIYYPNSGAPSGGTWTSSNTSVMVIDPITGVHHTVSIGTCTITYSTGGCPAIRTITVVPMPASITGPGNVCLGSSISLTDASTGGTWNSSNTTIATVSSGGVVTGSNASTVTITYTVNTCIATKTVTVEPIPAIFGPGRACTGTNPAFTSSTLGGTWSSSNTSIVTVGSTGIGTYITPGTATITYTSPPSCINTTTVTVLQSPASITGISALCVGSTATLSDASGGGTWSSSSTSVAPIGSTSGTYIGMSAGTAHIFYTISNGCQALQIVTVNPSPGPILGSASLCMSFAPTFTDAVSGGTWSSSNTAVATMGSTTGTISYVTAGTTILTYTLSSGCFATLAVNIDPIVPAITGPSHEICAGSSFTLNDALTGGLWSSSATAIATIVPTSGVLAGLSPGTAMISYLRGACGAGYTITVNPLPAAITGTSLICSGNTITLSDADPGGTWSTTSTTITVGGTSGVITGTTAGTATITYTLSTGCLTTLTLTIAPPAHAITGGPMACVGSTMTLSDADAGGTWTSSNSTVATVATLGLTTGLVTPLTAGVATITYETSPGCVVHLNIQVWNEACNPCTILGNNFQELPTPGAISSSMTGGLYYTPNPVTITGPTTLRAMTMMMAPTAGIAIDPNAVVTLAECHLLGCSMWPGIDVQTNLAGTLTGKLSMTDTSLIEDATIAVNMVNAVAPISGNLLTIDNVIFNRNGQGIHIENYFPVASTYPFQVRNATFTSRDLSVYSTLYPNTWPDNNNIHGTGLKDLWAPSPSDVYSAPVNIGDAGSPYSTTVCKDGKLSYCGIWLQNVGTETPSTTYRGGRTVPAAYYDIVVGDDAVTGDNHNLNVFDHMCLGVYAYNSNVSCLNNLFMDMIYDGRPFAWPSSTGIYPAPAPVFYPTGDGVFATSALDGTQQKRLQVYSTPGSGYNNRFYGFNIGVQCENYYSMNLQNNYLINKTPPVPGWMLSPGYSSGQYGYKLNSAHYNDINVITDTINNIYCGVYLLQDYQPLPSGGPWFGTGYRQYTGNCTIQNNIIQAHPSGMGTVPAYEAVQHAIWVQNALTTYLTVAGYGSSSGQVSINYNKIKDAYSGIFVNYNFQQKASSNDNSITLRTIGNNGLRYGINHTSSTGDAMWTNTVTTSSGAMVGLGDSTMRAYYSAYNTGVNVSCNIESKVSRGFEFAGTNAGAQWRVNDMEDNQRGFVLNAGIIGTQGSPSVAINNRWLGSTWNVLNNPQTYVYHGADAAQDTLYVNWAGSGTRPTINSGQFLLRYYSSATTPPATGSYSCPPPLPIGLEGISEYESMIRNSILLSTSTMPKKWMNQYELWRSIQYDTALVDSSVAIAQFASMAQHSRYSYLTNIESQLADGNLDSAIALLTYDIDTLANTDTDAVTGVRVTDSTTADNIVMNYQKFYNIYIKYLQVAMSNEDSTNLLALAQLCPHMDGKVVFQARALYSFVFNDLSMFNDDSCFGADTNFVAEWKHGGGRVTAQDIGGQGYKLYPNPNDGNITLRQLVSDTGMVRIEVYDVVGRSIYRNKLSFINKTANLHLDNIVPGVYLLQITGADDKVYRFKFVKE